MLKTLSIIVLLTTNVFSQDLVLRSLPDYEGEFDFKFLRPTLKESNSYFFYSGIYYFSAKLPITDIHFFTLSVPLSIYHSNEQSVAATQGNIQIGMQTINYYSESHRASLAFDLYLPTSGSNESFFQIVNLWANPYQSYKHFKDVTSFVSNITNEWNYKKRLFFRSDIGLALLFFDFEDDLNVTAVLHYGLGINYHVFNFILTSEILGSLFPGYLFDDVKDIFNSVNIGINLNVLDVKPGIFYLHALKENSIIKNSIGINIKYNFETMFHNLYY